MKLVKTMACLFFFGATALIPIDGSLCLIGSGYSHAGEGAGGGKGVKYSCGMHPMVIVDEPGTCPICGMDLTPVGANSPAAGSLKIHVDAVTSQRMGIRTAVAENRELSRRIHTVGLVAFEEPQQYAINSKISGWVEKLHVNETGQTVASGDPLLEIYSPDLVAAQEELLLALRNQKKMRDSGFPGVVEDAERLLQAARRRLQFWDIDPQQIADLEKTGRVKKSLALYAPCSGVVSRKQVREGEFVNSGRELLEISSISNLWLYADIYESETPWVKEGQRAEVRFPFESELFTGRISTIYPYLDAQTRTIKARIDLPNPGFKLKPDMYADVMIISDPIANALSIPEEAVLYTGKKETVFVALEDGHFEPRTVKTGLHDEDGYVQILQGIEAGERVVTSAQFMLDSESKLREAVQKMLEPKSEEASLEDLFND